MVHKLSYRFSLFYIPKCCKHLSRIQTSMSSLLRLGKLYSLILSIFRACLTMNVKELLWNEAHVISTCLRFINIIFDVRPYFSMRLQFTVPNGTSFCIISDSKLGQKIAISVKSNPQHCIFNPFNWRPIISKQLGTSSRIIFSKVKYSRCCQRLKTGWLSLLTLLLPKNMVLRLRQQFEIVCSFWSLGPL